MHSFGSSWYVDLTRRALLSGVATFIAAPALGAGGLLLGTPATALGNLLLWGDESGDLLLWGDESGQLLLWGDGG